MVSAIMTVDDTQYSSCCWDNTAVPPYSFRIAYMQFKSLACIFAGRNGVDPLVPPIQRPIFDFRKLLISKRVFIFVTGILNMTLFMILDDFIAFPQSATLDRIGVGLGHGRKSFQADY